MFDDIEYVDPDKDRCPECNCSFGVHLKTCSKFQCLHSRLNEDGICRACGQDRRGI